MSLANMSFSLDCACAACGHNYSTVLDIFYLECGARKSSYIGCWADGPLNIIFNRWWRNLQVMVGEIVVISDI